MELEGVEVKSMRNYLEKITEVYCFVSSAEDGEGVIAQIINIDGQPTFFPFVCADKKRMEDLKPLAIEIGRISGKKIKLIRLTHREELEEFNCE